MAVKVSVAGSGTTTASLSTVNPNVKISTIGIQGPAGTGIDLTTAGTLTSSKAIVVDSDSKIDVLKSGDLVITGSANTIGHTDDTDLLTIASGTLTVAGTTITTGLTIGGTGVTSTADELNILDGVTSTATELNILDGDTSATSTTLAAADRIVVNDAGTMKQVALSDLETFMEDALDTGTNLTTVGALDSGSITSGFGTIDTGSSAITTTGLISGGSLDIDDVLINGTTIGHTDDTDLMTVASGLLTVAGEISVTTLDIGGTNVTSTATELNLMDGGTSAGTTAVAGGDGIVTNDGGTMRQTTVDTFDTYLSATTKTLTNKTLTTPTIAEIDSGSTITLDATTDIVLDADGGDIFFKDGGTTFGSATNTSGNLIIKSGTTTAATFSGANVTFAGTLAASSIDGGSFS
jgi:hypothetical protein